MASSSCERKSVIKYDVFLFETILYCDLESKDFMKEAVLAIQSDEAFQLESEFTCAALKQTLEAWCPVNEEK